MKVCRPALCVALLLLASVAPAFSDNPAAGAPYELHAILSLTGPAAFLGMREQKSFDAFAEFVNRTGGIHGRPIKFVYSDDGTSPQTAVQLAGPIIAGHVPAFFGPTLSGACRAVAAMISASGPVQYCLSPLLHPAAGSYVFTAMVSSTDMMTAQIRYFRERGWTRVAAIASTDASGQDFSAGLDAALRLPENKNVQFVANEKFNPTDLTIAAQANRIKAASPQAILALTSGTPFGTVLQGLRDAGVGVPVGASNANMLVSQLQGYGSFLPTELYFAGFRSMVEGSARPGPIRNAQDVYFGALRTAKVTPDVGTAITWDAAMLVVDALRHAPADATADQVHDYIENVPSWTGINGVYNFHDGSQRGLSTNALLIDRYDPKAAAFVPVSRPGGLLK